MVVGSEDETAKVRYPEITYVNSLVDAIDYLKYCKVFITMDSGMKDFALNCGCKRVIMFVHDEIDKKYHVKYNPFDAQIKIARQSKFSKNVKVFDDFIKEAIKSKKGKN